MSAVSVAQPDVTLRLDSDGVIREVSVSADLAREDAASLVGRPWFETVADVGEMKVRSMVQDARDRRVAAFRQVTQCFPSGRELLIEYTTVDLGNDGLIAIGRNLQAVAEVQSRLLSAQVEVEREHWRLREVQTRYELLFESSSDAVLLVRAGDMGVVEANPAAVRALGMLRHSTGSGVDLMSLVAAQERAPFQALLLRVREEGSAPATLVHLGESRTPWLVRASLMVTETGNVYLLQLTRVGGARPNPGLDLDFEEMTESMPGALVVLGADAGIVWANRGFLDLVKVHAREWVIGQSLARWLSSPWSDVGSLLAALRSTVAAQGFIAEIRSELGDLVPVHLATAQRNGADGGYICLLVRGATTGRLDANRHALDRTLDHVSILLGERNLAELSNEAKELFERYCVGLALQRADQDPVRAAKLLGLSRNGLRRRLSGASGAAGQQPSLDRDD